MTIEAKSYWIDFDSMKKNPKICHDIIIPSSTKMGGQK